MKSTRISVSFSQREAILLSDLVKAWRSRAETQHLLARPESDNLSMLVHNAARRAAQALRKETTARDAADAAAASAMAELDALRKHGRVSSPTCRNGHLYTTQSTLLRTISGRRQRVCKTCIQNRRVRNQAEELRSRKDGALERMVAERRVAS